MRSSGPSKSCRAALVDHALQLENGIVHSLHLNTIRFIRKEYT